jgi:hypothetical protein
LWSGIRRSLIEFTLSRSRRCQALCS